LVYGVFLFCNKNNELRLAFNDYLILTIYY